MAILGTLIKQPREIIDVDISYAKVLGSRVTDEITTSIEVPAGMTLGAQTIGSDSVKLFVSGGASGQTYRWTVLTDLIVGGMTIRVEDEFLVSVEEVY
jgi:hypothetical protein